MPFKCDQCDKEFNTQQGLDQHKADKHGMSKHEKREMKKQQIQSEQKSAASSAKRKKTVRNAVIVAVILIAIIGVGWVVLSYKSSDYLPALAGSDNSIGATNASVVMVEYSDFQCPYCGRFYTQTEQQIMDAYVSTGKVRFVYRHFPLSQVHSYAEKAAEASECAADQGKFWEYHNKLFENQKSLYLNSLKQYASDIGLNSTQFNTCLDSGVMQQRVSQDYKAGASSGVSSTPTFFVNDKKVEGAQPFSAFQSAIDSQLGR